MDDFFGGDSLTGGGWGVEKIDINAPEVDLIRLEERGDRLSSLDDPFSNSFNSFNYSWGEN